MGRVFTINFSFAEKVSSALVCMYEKQYDILFKVHVFNEELHQTIAGGNLEFSLIDGVNNPEILQCDTARQLAGCIAEAISCFLDGEGKLHAVSS